MVLKHDDVAVNHVVDSSLVSSLSVVTVIAKTSRDSHSAILELEKSGRSL